MALWSGMSSGVSGSPASDIKSSPISDSMCKSLHHPSIKSLNASWSALMLDDKYWAASMSDWWFRPLLNGPCAMLDMAMLKSRQYCFPARRNPFLTEFQSECVDSGVIIMRSPTVWANAYTVLKGRASSSATLVLSNVDGRKFSWSHSVCTFLILMIWFDWFQGPKLKFQDANANPLFNSWCGCKSDLN